MTKVISNFKIPDNESLAFALPSDRSVEIDLEIRRGFQKNTLAILQQIQTDWYRHIPESTLL